MKDKVVTVFGGSGFIGRYVVRDLLARGARVRIAGRNPGEGWFLKTQGGLGQTQFVAADIRKPASVARALAGSHAAVNLVGILTGDFTAFHVDGARNVAEGAATAGCGALVHVSALGADPASGSTRCSFMLAGIPAARSSSRKLRNTPADCLNRRLCATVRNLPESLTRLQPRLYALRLGRAVKAIEQALRVGVIEWSYVRH